MHNIYLFQPQWSVESSQGPTYWIPYSAGSLWSYAQQFDFVQENFVLKDIIFNRRHPDDIVSSLDNPKICGFSCYVWNYRYCIEIAKLIKQHWPDCVIVIGGPQASAKSLENNFVDCVSLGEGEENFVDILKYVKDQQPIPTILTKKRLGTLDFPSPYTSGIFDPLLENNPNALWSIVLESNRGCPYQCTFCDWGSTTYSKVKKFDLTRVTEEIEWAIKNPVVFMFLADANFGRFKERDLEIAKMIRRMKTDGHLEMAVVQYAKNSNKDIFEIAKVLEDVSRGITVSVQSLNAETLKAIKRENMKINQLTSILEESVKQQVSTYTEFILGLPEETLDSWKSGLCMALEMGQHNSMDVWFSQLLENSELNSFESKVKYGIKTITAQDFTLFSNPADYKGILEDITIVNQTKTMSTEDIAEAYMYAWMIINFHIDGYTQILSKAAYHLFNINYRTFYDKLFLLIKQSPEFQNHFNTRWANIYNYLKTGLLDEDIHQIRLSASPRLLTLDDSYVVYNNRHSIYNLGAGVLENLISSADIDSLLELQKHFIFEPDVQYPCTLTSQFDILSWARKTTSYEVSTRNTNGTAIAAVTARRNKKIKNIFKLFDTA